MEKRGERGHHGGTPATLDISGKHWVTFAFRTTAAKSNSTIFTALSRLAARGFRRFGKLVFSSFKNSPDSEHS